MFEIEIYVGHFVSTSLKKPQFFSSCAITPLSCLIRRDTQGYLTFFKSLHAGALANIRSRFDQKALFYVNAEVPARKVSCVVIGRALCVYQGGAVNPLGGRQCAESTAECVMKAKTNKALNDNRGPSPPLPSTRAL